MRLGYTILYVEDVERAVAFYERAFGLARRFVHESGQYGELQTGATTLAFASWAQARASLPDVLQDRPPDARRTSGEIALVTPDVPAAFRRAVDAGARPLAPPEEKPWGQTSAHVQDLDGTLVELCTPTSSGPRHTLTLLAVADLSRAVSFYREALGWPPRIEVPVLVEFELPDGRGLGLYVREGFGANTGQLPEAVPPGAITGTEIYLHCDDLDAAIARMEGAGARVLSPRAVRDWGDEAAYFADPDGNVLVLARAAG